MKLSAKLVRFSYLGADPRVWLMLGFHCATVCCCLVAVISAASLKAKCAAAPGVLETAELSNESVKSQAPPKGEGSPAIPPSNVAKTHFVKLEPHRRWDTKERVFMAEEPFPSDEIDFSALGTGAKSTSGMSFSDW